MSAARRPTRMVGRDAELRELEGLLADAAPQASGSLVLVCGSAGVGKSRLVQEVAGRADGWRVLTARAYDGQPPGPFHLLRDAFEPVVAAWDGLPADLEVFRHGLAHLLTPWVTFDRHPEDGHAHHPGELLALATRLCRVAATERPLLLVLEDLQWADAETLRLLARLGELDGSAIVAVATVRTSGERVDGPIAALLDEVTRSTRTRRLELAELGPDQVGALIESLTGVTPPVSVAELLHQRTGGNPYFLEELVAAAAESAPGGQVADPATLLDTSLPSTVAEVVQRRLGIRDAAQRSVLEHAAILHDGFSFELLRELLEEDAAELTERLRALIDRGLLEEAEPDRFRYRHALTRDVVGRSLLEHERRSLHRRALAVLASRAPVEPSVLAHHARGAGEVTSFVEHATRAAEEALARGAPRHAFRIGISALPAADGSLPLHRALARAAAHLGDLVTARTHAERWASLAEAGGDEDDRVRAWCHLVWLHFSAGERASAWDALEQAELGGDPAARSLPAEAWPLAIRGQLHAIEGRYTEAIPDAEGALALAEGVGDDRLRRHALITLATARSALAELRSGEILAWSAETLAAVRDEAEASGDLDALTRAYNNSMVPGNGIVTIEAALPVIAEAERVARTYGLDRFAGKVAGIAAYVATLRGDLAAAEAALARGTSHGAPIDDAFASSQAAIVASEAARSAQAAQALASIDEYRDEATREQFVDVALAESYLAAATADAVLGRRSLHRISTIVGEVGRGAADGWWDVAINAVSAGVPPEEVRDLRERQAPPVSSRTEAPAAHLDAVLAVANGDLEAARHAYDVAVDEPVGYRPVALVAEAAAGYAELLARQGEMTAARGQAARACELLAGWPGWRRERAVALRRRLERARAGGSEQLTVREHEVCRLVARGLTNGEIADRLFISPKTASVHVSSILRKTGLRRRTQLVAWAHDHLDGIDDGGPQDTAGA